ncbi:putative Late nodulin [Medicago truncatula]|uniref:Putative Late nodulin n=1 Tax=Medicago truncatula TaxID=3880 RepID=A0A396JI16_MEDTR|nr:putative Late nodulin [Medicago truncatula]
MNMAEIVKYIYVIIIFLSLFLVATNIEAFFRCKNDFDCVHKRCRGPMRAKCISKAICKCRLAFTLK